MPIAGDWGPCVSAAHHAQMLLSLDLNVLESYLSRPFLAVLPLLNFSSIKHVLWANIQPPSPELFSKLLEVNLSFRKAKSIEFYLQVFFQDLFILSWILSTSILVLQEDMTLYITVIFSLLANYVRHYCLGFTKLVFGRFTLESSKPKT